MSLRALAAHAWRDRLNPAVHWLACLYALDEAGEVWWRAVGEDESRAKALAGESSDLEEAAGSLRFHLGDRVEIRVGRRVGKLQELAIDEKFELTRGFAKQIGSAFLLAANESPRRRKKRKQS